MKINNFSDLKKKHFVQVLLFNLFSFFFPFLQPLVLLKLIASQLLLYRGNRKKKPLSNTICYYLGNKLVL